MRTQCRERECTPLQHLHITADAVAALQLQCSAGIKCETVPLMAQLSILHPHGGGRARMRGDTIALVDCPIFHTQATTIKVGHGVNLRSTGS